MLTGDWSRKTWGDQSLSSILVLLRIIWGCLLIYKCLGPTKIYQIRIPGDITQGILDSCHNWSLNMQDWDYVEYVKQLHIGVTAGFSGVPYGKVGYKPRHREFSSIWYSTDWRLGLMQHQGQLRGSHFFLQEPEIRNCAFIYNFLFGLTIPTLEGVPSIY